jgi:hypothetical protein
MSAYMSSLMLASFYVNASIWMSLTKVTSPKSKGLIDGLETTIFYIAMVLFSDSFIIIGTVFALLVTLTFLTRLITLISDK